MAESTRRHIGQIGLAGVVRVVPAERLEIEQLRARVATLEAQIVQLQKDISPFLGIKEAARDPNVDRNRAIPLGEITP